MAELSARRWRIVNQIVPSVVPSTWGDDKFEKIDKNWKPGDRYTTCGGLPAYVASQLGVSPEVRREGITGGGLLGMRDAAIRRGAWVHHDITLRFLAGGMGLEGEMRRPKPGDFYLLCSGDVGRHKVLCNCLSPSNPNNYRGAAIEHVGIVISAEGNVWKTADAGQSDGQVMVNGEAKNRQAARYVERTFNPTTGELVGEADRRGGRPMRRLCGWVDVDKFPFLT